MDYLRITDLRFHGHCGCTEAERAMGQRLSVDLELELPLDGVVLDDNLGRTIDYVRLAREVVELGREARLQLIETLAEQIAQYILVQFRPRQVRVRLRKMLPPVEEINGAFEIELTRSLAS